MSKPREKWWGYIKNVIRSYPDLKKRYDQLHEISMSVQLTGIPSSHKVSSPVENVALRQLNPTAQRELDAVQSAINVTKRMYCGDIRLQIIDLVFWKQTHTIEGAAQRAHVSERTARRWHTAFIYLVAEKFGLNRINE